MGHPVAGDALVEIVADAFDRPALGVEQPGIVGADGDRGRHHQPAGKPEFGLDVAAVLIAWPRHEEGVCHRRPRKGRSQLGGKLRFGSMKCGLNRKIDVRHVVETE